MNDTARGTCRLQHHNNDRHITPPPAVNHSAGELRREITKRWKSDNVIYMYEEAPAAAGCLNSYSPRQTGARFFAACTWSRAIFDLCFWPRDHNERADSHLSARIYTHPFANPPECRPSLRKLSLSLWLSLRMWTCVSARWLQLCYMCVRSCYARIRNEREPSEFQQALNLPEVPLKGPAYHPLLHWYNYAD